MDEVWRDLLHLLRSLSWDDSLALGFRLFSLLPGFDFNTFTELVRVTCFFVFYELLPM